MENNFHVCLKISDCIPDIVYKKNSGSFFVSYRKWEADHADRYQS